jgi:hypothetical protein
MKLALAVLTPFLYLLACSVPPTALEYTEDPPAAPTLQERLNRSLDSLEREEKKCEPWPQCYDPKPPAPTLPPP